MSHMVTILFPEGLGDATLPALEADLRTLDEVTRTGQVSTRAITRAAVALWVGLAADTLGVAAVAVAVFRKIADRLKAKGVRGTVIELPNGVKIAMDSASPDQVVAMVSAWHREQEDWSRRGPPAEP